MDLERRDFNYRKFLFLNYKKNFGERKRKELPHKHDKIKDKDMWTRIIYINKTLTESKVYKILWEISEWVSHLKLDTDVY